MKAARSMSGQVGRAALARGARDQHASGAPAADVESLPRECATLLCCARNSELSDGMRAGETIDGEQWTNALDTSFHLIKELEPFVGGRREVSLHAMPAQGRTYLVAHARQHGLTHRRGAHRPLNPPEAEAAAGASLATADVCS
jgi:hypothetical protein